MVQKEEGERKLGKRTGREVKCVCHGEEVEVKKTEVCLLVS